MKLEIIKQLQRRWIAVAHVGSSCSWNFHKLFAMCWSTTTRTLKELEREHTASFDVILTDRSNILSNFYPFLQCHRVSQNTNTEFIIAKAKYLQRFIMNIELTSGIYVSKSIQSHANNDEKWCKQTIKIYRIMNLQQEINKS